MQTKISLIRAFTLYNNVCIFLIHYAMVYAFLSHLSQSLTGEVLENRCSPFFLNFFLQNHFANHSQIICGASMVVGTQICLEYQGHMNKDGCLSADINILYPRGDCTALGCIHVYKKVRGACLLTSLFFITYC